ncbi:hypothetical protein FRC18_003398 [Serendipita sp. 400]|nr:hypothetical protein FRC18_003398 [Serendipita sp. 400]
MSSSFFILVGSFTPFISTLSFTTFPTPSLSLVSQATSGTSPSWLLSNPQNSSIFYATDETEDGSLHSLVVDPVTGKVTPVASISTQGGSPTHINFVGNGTGLGVANYGGGSAFFTTLQEDGLQFGGGQLVKFDQVQSSNAHQIVDDGTQVLVPDLGADRVWRLGQLGSDQWSIQGSIPQQSGSGPRHLVVDDGSIYTLHEHANTLTQQTAASSFTDGQPAEVASISIIPSDTPSGSTLFAGEVLMASTPTPLIYASNRDDPSTAGDAIAIFETNPLTKVAEVRTGLNHLRGVAFVGDDNAYLIAGGMKGGGIKVYERVSAELGYLKEVASLPAGVIEQPSSFIWVSSQSPVTEGDSTTTTQPQVGTATSTIPVIVPTISRSAGCRRFKIGR